MSRKKQRNTKGKIVSAAWDLFYKQGYEETTIEEIIEESHTSRGSFYHYFQGKDSLLSTLSYLFDEKYEELERGIKDEDDSFEVLLFLNRELFRTMENRISIDLLSRLYSTQLVTKGYRHLQDGSRTYYRLLRAVISRGQEKGTLRRDWTVNDIVKYYAMQERAFIYDWCLCNGEYSLSDYSCKLMPGILQQIKA